MGSDLRRLVTFAVSLPVVLAVTLVPADWPLVLLIAFVAVAGSLELAGLKRLAPGPAAAGVLAAGVAPLCVWAGAGPWALVPWLVALVIAWGVMAAWGAGVEGVLLVALYCGMLPAHAVAMKMRIPEGGRLLLWTLFVVWACDAAAYVVGRTAGKRLLLPRVSPRKTVEGALGGLVGAAVVGALGYLVVRPALSWGEAFLFPLVVAVVGTVGDLAESALKRGAGVKDSGRMLPGHGGMLDALDSALFAVPVVFWLWVFMEM